MNSLPLHTYLGGTLDQCQIRGLVIPVSPRTRRRKGCSRDHYDYEGQVTGVKPILLRCERDELKRGKTGVCVVRRKGWSTSPETRVRGLQFRLCQFHTFGGITGYLGGLSARE